MQPFPYQIEGAKFLAEKKRALLADKPRVGKTGSAIGAADLVGAEDILELTTSSARTDHAKAWRAMQTTRRKVTPIYSASDDIPTSGVVITSYALGCGPLRKRFQWHGWDAIIPDESHRLKNWEIPRTHAVYGEKCDGDGGLIEGVSNVWTLSGTPAPNHYGELWTTFRALRPDLIPNKVGNPMTRATFEARFCQFASNGFGDRIVGSRNHKKLKPLLDDMMLRRSLQNVRPGMPEIVYDTLELDLSGHLADLREIERDELVREYQRRLDAAHDDAEQAGILAEVERRIGMRLRRLTGMAKVNAVVDWLKEQFADGLENIVLFAHHTDVIDTLIKVMPFDSVVVDGRSTPRQRDVAMATFQNRKVPVFIGQLDAAGEAIDLSAADQCLFVESSWVPGTNSQCAHRMVNVNKMVSVLARFATIPDSIDLDIQRTNVRKLSDLSRLFS